MGEPSTRPIRRERENRRQSVERSWMDGFEDEGEQEDEDDKFFKNERQA
jgi:hypothetical protein